MPLKSGTNKRMISANFHELRHGKQYKKTARKHGKKRAQKQMIAIVLKKVGKSRKKK